MAWIDFKKAYGVGPPSQIIDCLKMYKTSGEVIKFIENTMQNSRVELTVGGKSLTEEKIQRALPGKCAIINSDDAIHSHT